MNNNSPSPCVGLCELDKTKQFCIACKRTIKQIVQAGEEKKKQKQKIKSKLDYYSFEPRKKNRQKNRPPCISFLEAVEKFNVPAATLRGLLRAKDAPKTVHHFRGRAYYVLPELKLFIEKFQQGLL